MLWDKGIEKAPLSVKQCYQSWIIKNPDYIVQILNLEEAEMLIDRKNIINNSTWSDMKIEAKSDLIRAFLLMKFGGVWIDATVLCLKPLSDWMNYSRPFLTFKRNFINNDRYLDINGSKIIGMCFLDFWYVQDICKELL